MKYRQKAVSFILAVLMIFTALPISNINVNAAVDYPVDILYNGQKVSSVIVAENEEITLESKLDGINADAYNWQIKADAVKDLWVDIDGYTDDLCVVNYALVGSLLDETDTAYLRLAVSNGENTYYSNPVAVNISYVVITPYEAELDTTVPALDDISTANTKSKARMASGKSRSANNAIATVDESELVTYDITVNFLYQSGAEVTQANKINKKAGEDHYVVIEVPTAAGYAPYYDADGNGTPEKLAEKDDDGKIIFEIDIKNISADITYNIWYLPDYVTYTVNHYFQNLNDEVYTIKKTEKRTGLTGALVPGDLYLPENEATGYSHYAYEQPAIAADGTTSIDIYYHINFYFVEYDLGKDAFGVEPLYVRYGTVVTVKEPTRSGYHFEGWELVGYDDAKPTDEQKTLYNLNDGSVTVPAANLKYMALWTQGDTVYTVVYWREAESKAGSNESITYEYWGSRLVGGYETEGGYIEYDGKVKAGDTVSPNTVVGNGITCKDVPEEIRNIQGTNIDETDFLEYNANESDDSQVVNGDGTTVLNIYYDRKTYTLKFYYAGGLDGNTYIMGRTNDFGTGSKNQASFRDDEKALFNRAWTRGSYYSFPRRVNDKPEINNPEINNKEQYIFGEDTYTSNNKNYTYYYFTFQAKYGSDISEMWPTTEDIGSVVMSEGSYKTTVSTDDGRKSWDSAVCTFSGWNGEVNTYYTQHANADFETIKGEYRKLDYRILWDTSLAATNNAATYNNTVTYLAYWSNAARRDWGVPALYRYNIYLECLDQSTNHDSVCIEKTHLELGGKYYYLATRYEVADNSEKGNLDNQTYPPVEGFAINDSLSYNKVIADGDYVSTKYLYGNDIYWVYDRVRYDLKFNNNGTHLPNKDANGEYVYNNLTIRYGVNLGGQDSYNLNEIYKTDEDGKTVYDENGKPVLMFYPENLEPNAYEFEDWYSSPTFASSTRFEFSENYPMPAHEVVLYANWVPVMHDVTLYLDRTEAVKPNGSGTRLYEKTVQVQHGSLAPTPRQDYKNGDLTFVGWFYLDSTETDENGQPVEKAFSFETIPVTQDMNIYAKWTDNFPREYTVYYRYYSDADTYVDVAPSTTGTALLGANITVNAKVGDQLSSEYRVGYFPEIESHSISITAENKNNIFVFEYKLIDAVPYTVKYEDADGKPLHTAKTVTDNRYTVVTEKFVQIDGYLPDKYSKELTVVADGENVITFFYTKNDTDAYYKIVHYTQNVSGDGYTEYKSIEKAGEIGSPVSDSILDIVGFKFENATMTVSDGENGEQTTSLSPNDNGLVSGEITSSGLLIEIYYNRLECRYTVEYRKYDSTAENNNGKELAAAKEVESVLYGTVVTENALTIAGYDLVSQTPQSRVIGTDGQVIVFHYSEKNIDITYVALNGGSVDTVQESVAAVTGNPNGSTATADTGYKFVGWYKNEACTLSVDSTWVDENNKLVPKPVDNLHQAITYYAKFEKATADLYIFTDFPANNNYRQLDAGQSYIFTVKGVAGTATKDINLTVSLHERDGITVVDLPVGNYVVTQLTDWSWRYKPLHQNYREITVKADGSTDPKVSGGNWVRFTNSRTDGKWLDGNSYNENIFVGNAN